MDDPQWCLDECPTCATVVHGQSIYCSPECEPEAEQESQLEHDDTLWNHSNSTRISAWALHCYKATTIAPASSPCIFPSPSRQKLHLRKKHPTSWVTSGTSFDPSRYISSSISTGTAVESLVTSSTVPTSPTSRWSAPVRSWTSASPGPPTPPLLTKTNVYLFSGSTARPPMAESSETSDYPVTPLEASMPAEKAQHSRPSCPMLKQRQRRDDRTA
ncbi:hypothetical protein B0H19DRAFT_1149764 [Mycena capillaripes]|nr:hypothetical protein B0H19DRAFT_1149764 [Mycena capillaripes]